MHSFSNRLKDSVEKLWPTGGTLTTRTELRELGVVFLKGKLTDCGKGYFPARDEGGYNLYAIFPENMWSKLIETRPVKIDECGEVAQLPFKTTF